VSDWNTRYTLIQRAQDNQDSDTWEEFVSYYNRFIYYILRQMKVSDSIIDDLVQDVLLNLWNKLGQYTKEKARFKNWLTSVIRNTAIDGLIKEKRYNTRQENAMEAIELLRSVPESDFEKIISKEWRAYLIRLSLGRMKEYFSPKIIEVFKLSMEGTDAGVIAEKLGMSKDTVYTLKNRVKIKFTREMTLLVRELEF